MRVMRERYRRAVGRAAKGALLDELERVLGWHRKHAIRAMASAPARAPRVRRGRPRQYLACLSAIERVWEALDYCCAERLHPQLQRLARDLVRHGELEAPAEVLEELGRISRATVARRIAALERPRPRRLPVAPHPQRLLKTAVPIGRFAWDESRAGALEVDLVEHNGGSSSGHYAATLSVVDVVSGWSRRRAVLGKSQAVVHEALQRLLSEWPSPVWGLHSDNGAEFLNNHLVRYCRQHAIEYHRSRAYRKNDNAHVEQKNRQLVREVVGYGRYDQPADVLWLNGVYELLDAYANVVLPSQKLIGKTRDGAKLRKRYDTARTPLERLQELGAISPQRQAELAALQRDLNPLALKRELDARLERRGNPPAALAEAAD
ncbi:MAG: DDE-type integrase/transposase/recombinase [Trueperaceae bacterium]|nr:DDE-type integrase/transposase/recombinase [Trueperaceae bacterium]